MVIRSDLRDAPQSAAAEEAGAHGRGGVLQHSVSWIALRRADCALVSPFELLRDKFLEDAPGSEGDEDACEEGGVRYDARGARRSHNTIPKRRDFCPTALRNWEI